jgi:hypothetical protein
MTGFVDDPRRVCGSSPTASAAGLIVDTVREVELG